MTVEIRWARPLSETSHFHSRFLAGSHLARGLWASSYPECFHNFHNQPCALSGFPGHLWCGTAPGTNYVSSNYLLAFYFYSKFLDLVNLYSLKQLWKDHDFTPNQHFESCGCNDWYPLKTWVGDGFVHHFAQASFCTVKEWCSHKGYLKFPSLLYYLISQLAKIHLFVINKWEVMDRRNERWFLMYIFTELWSWGYSH